MTRKKEITNRLAILALSAMLVLANGLGSISFAIDEGTAPDGTVTEQVIDQEEIMTDDVAAEDSIEDEDTVDIGEAEEKDEIEIEGLDYFEFTGSDEIPEIKLIYTPSEDVEGDNTTDEEVVETEQAETSDESDEAPVDNDVQTDETAVEPESETESEPAEDTKPEPVELVEGVDYTITVENDMEAGIATVTIEAIDKTAVSDENTALNGQGDAVESSENELTDASVIVNEEDVDTEIIQDEEIQENGDVADVTDSETAEEPTEETPQILFSGKIVKTFAIKKANISGYTVSGISGKTYTGSAITQNITVKNGNTTLRNGTDYTVSYANNVKVGTATVTITGKGNYTGTISRTFKINSRLASVLKLSSVNVQFKRKVEYDNYLPSGTLPTKLVLTGQKNSIKLSWKKAANLSPIDGYLILRKNTKTGRYVQIAAVGKNTTVYVDKAASKKNTFYTYSVTSYKRNGDIYRTPGGIHAWVGGVTTRSSKKNYGTPKFSVGGGNLTVGNTKTLKIKFPLRIRSKSIRWSSSNTAVATVNSKGVVTAKKAGKATITAKSATGRTASTTVTVKAKPVATATATKAATNTNKIPAGSQMIDVSVFNGSINWSKVKASGINYAILRLGYSGAESGKFALDTTFHTNMKNAKSAGVKVGVYYFTLATSESMARREADDVINTLQRNGYSVDLPIAVDVETGLSYTQGKKWNALSAAKRTAYVKAFCERVKARGYTPMIYASTSWLEGRLNMSQLPYQVWVAQYYRICQYSGSYRMWQYTSSGKVNGISGRVDMSYIYY